MKSTSTDFCYLLDFAPHPPPPPLPQTFYMFTHNFQYVHLNVFLQVLAVLEIAPIGRLGLGVCDADPFKPNLNYPSSRIDRLVKKYYGVASHSMECPSRKRDKDPNMRWL